MNTIKSAKSLKNFKKTILGIFFASSFFLVLPTEAHASCGPTDQTGGGMVVGDARNTGSNIAGQSTLNCFYDETMTWFKKIYTYMWSGYVDETQTHTDDGQGVVGLLKALVRQQDNQRDFDQEAAANDIQHQQRIAVEAAIAQKLVNNHPDPRDCMDAPNRMASRGGASGAISRVAKGAIEAKVAQESVKKNDLEHMTAVFKNRKDNGYCSPTDVQVIDETGRTIPRKTFTCETVGNMPDADARIQSIFTPAHDYTKPDKIKAVSLTFNNGKIDSNGLPKSANPNEDQYRASVDAISNIAARYQPPRQESNSENTAQGRAYLTKLKTYNARVSAGTNVLSTIAAMRTPGTGILDEAQAKEVWEGIGGESGTNGGLDTTKETYERIFGASSAGGPQFPEVPSEAELMRFEVLRRYADRDPAKSWDAKLMLNKGTAQLEVARTLAVTNFLLYQIHSRVEEGNSVAAIQLLQDINPITKAEMDGYAARSNFGAKRE